MLTALWFAPLFLAAAWFGAPYFTILIAAAAFGGALEFYRLWAVPPPLLATGLVFTLLLTVSPHWPWAQGLLLTALVIVSLAVMLASPPAERRLGQWAATMAGALYLGWLLSQWLSLRSLEGGREWVSFGLLVVFASDTAAFFVGRRWGRRPLAPHISPKKTREGAIGGLAGAMLTALALSFLFSINVALALALGLALSVAGQVGDLVESYLKRCAGAKDSGRLLPGHGGILDRLDSIVFAGPLLYHVVRWLI